MLFLSLEDVIGLVKGLHHVFGALGDLNRTDPDNLVSDDQLPEMVVIPRELFDLKFQGPLLSKDALILLEHPGHLVERVCQRIGTGFLEIAFSPLANLLTRLLIQSSILLIGQLSLSTQRLVTRGRGL